MLPHFDLLLNGANGAAPDADTRERADIARIVAEELAQGATIDDACSAAIVPPHRYLRWCDEDEALQERHAQALRIRAQVLGDTPLKLARELRQLRHGERASVHRLGDEVKAVEAEARLTGNAVGPAQTDKGAPISIRITFDQLPSHLLQAPTDHASAAALDGASGVSDAIPADYEVLSDDTGA